MLALERVSIFIQLNITHRVCYTVVEDTEDTS